MADRRVGDWRDGVDLDAEMIAWRSSTKRAQIVFAVGLVVAIAFMAVFAVIGNDDGIFYMATAVFFMAIIAGTLMLVSRRTT